MKLLTLNTHSLVEENYPEKLEQFVAAIVKEQPDVIALQEVNQSISAPEVTICKLKGFIPCGRVSVKADNHAYNAVKMLSERGFYYNWTWLGIKEGYEKYEEGIALPSRRKITETDILTVSRTNDRNNWKTRKVVGIRTLGQWFYSVHLGWWNDAEEPFQLQWKKLSAHTEKKSRVWLMGDFNSPAHIRSEGYDMIENDGWYDSYVLAENKDRGITVEKSIDGWRNGTLSQGMCIDHIWCSKKTEVASSEVIFNGINYPVISDHYGVIINTKD
jgi:maltose 6'-phosphate phosphatase